MGEGHILGKHKIQMSFVKIWGMGKPGKEWFRLVNSVWMEHGRSAQFLIPPHLVKPVLCLVALFCWVRKEVEYKQSLTSRQATSTTCVWASEAGSLYLLVAATAKRQQNGVGAALQPKTSGARGMSQEPLETVSPLEMAPSLLIAQGRKDTDLHRPS